MSGGSVLFLSTSMPPMAESQAIRNVFLLRGLAEAGWSIDVVAPPAIPGDESLLGLLPPRVTVWSTGVPAYDRLARGIGALPGAGARTLLARVLARGAGFCTAPDVRFDWSWHASRIARKLCRRRRPSAIVSSSGSYSAHIAAARLTRRLAIPWLADLGDPWSRNPLRPASYPHIRFLNRLLERATLAHCRRLTVTTRETARDFRELLGGSVPVDVIPCGFTPPPMVSPVPAAAGTLVVSYVGTAGRGSRDLNPVVKALQQGASILGCQIELRMIGACSPEFGRWLPPAGPVRIVRQGWIPYLDSLAEMAAADVLLLCGNAAPLQVPGKVFNYLASGRPILYLSQLDPRLDATARLLAGVPGVCALDRDAPDAAARIAAMLTRLDVWKRDSRERAAAPWLAAYSWDAIGRSFAASLAAIAACHPQETPSRHATACALQL
jgi:hypothetical protein